MIHPERCVPGVLMGCLALNIFLFTKITRSDSFRSKCFGKFPLNFSKFYVVERSVFLEVYGGINLKIFNFKCIITKYGKMKQNASEYVTESYPLCSATSIAIFFLWGEY